jgi:hypothetical protein
MNKDVEKDRDVKGNPKARTPGPGPNDEGAGAAGVDEIEREKLRPDPRKK